MPRNLKITLAYDGADFYGWQVQPERRTIQGMLAEAIERITGERLLPQGSGRTDAGVHALGQVAHVDLAKAWETDTVRDALNAHLRPQPVAVLAAERVADDFDARFSATKRHYLYRIVNRRADLVLVSAAAFSMPRELRSSKCMILRVRCATWPNRLTAGGACFA